MRVYALALVLCIGSAVRAPLADAQTDDQPFVAHVERLLQTEATALAAQGFQPAMQPVIEMTAKAASRTVAVRLQAGATYAFIAACDQDCSHVELSLYDGRRSLLMRSPETNSIVIVSGAPQETGRYEVVLALPGCRERHCHLGLAVLQHGSPARDPIVIIGATAASSPPGSTASMERRPGHELEGNNYRELGAPTLQACEQFCFADARCRALEYYRKPRSCGLFDHLPQMKAAREIDVSIKRP